MKKTLLTGLAVGLLMAGTAIAAPYSQTFYGTATDGDYVSLSAGGINNSVTLNFDLTTKGYVQGAYNPITSAVLSFYFSDIDAGIPDTVRISAGFEDGGKNITEKTFDLGVFAPKTYKTLEVQAHDKPENGYKSDGVCVLNCTDTKSNTSNDEFLWSKTETKKEDESPGDGWVQGTCAEKDGSKCEKWYWTKTTEVVRTNKPNGSDWTKGACKNNCTDTILDTSNDEYKWTKEVVDVESHNDRTTGQLTIDLGLEGLLGYIQDGKFTSIVLTPYFGGSSSGSSSSSSSSGNSDDDDNDDDEDGDGNCSGVSGYSNDIRLDEAYLVAETTPFDPTPVPEPGTMVLLGIGMLGMAVYGKRRMNKA